MHPLEKCCHILLSPRSRSAGLSPAMRLVALTMLLWEEEWDRASFAQDEIADRTSLTVEQVNASLAKLEQVRLVDRRADGWQLTYDRFAREILPAWNFRTASRKMV